MSEQRNTHRAELIALRVAIENEIAAAGDDPKDPFEQGAIAAYQFVLSILPDAAYARTQGAEAMTLRWLRSHGASKADPFAEKIEVVADTPEAVPPTDGDQQRRCWTITNSTTEGETAQCWLYNGHAGPHSFGANDYAAAASVLRSTTRFSLAQALIGSDLIPRFMEYAREANPDTMRDEDDRDLAKRWAHRIADWLDEHGASEPVPALILDVERLARAIQHVDHATPYYDKQGKRPSFDDLTWEQRASKRHDAAKIAAAYAAEPREARAASASVPPLEDADRALAVTHREDEACGCDGCMEYAAEEEGADWHRLSPARRIALRVLDSGDERLAPLATAIHEHEEAYATETPEASR